MLEFIEQNWAGNNKLKTAIFPKNNPEQVRNGKKSKLRPNTFSPDTNVQSLGNQVCQMLFFPKKYPT